MWGFKWHCLYIRFSLAYFLKHLRNVCRAAILEDILNCHYHSIVANSAAAVVKKQRRVEENFKRQRGKKWGAQKTGVSKSPSIPIWTSELCTLVTTFGSCLPSWQVPPWPGSTGWGKTHAKMAETPFKKKGGKPKKTTNLLFGQLFGKL